MTFQWRDIKEVELKLVREKYAAVNRPRGIVQTGSVLYNEPLSIKYIHLEVSDELVPYDPDNDKFHKLFNTCIPQMQENILQEIGVLIPTVWVRSVRREKNTYIIIINEVPVVMGVIQIKSKFCPNFTQLEIRNTYPDLAYEFNPATFYNDGVWVDSSLWDDFLQSGGILWDCFEYMTNHLEAVLRERLHDIFGFEEILKITRQWQNEDKLYREKRTALINESLPDLMTRIQWAELIRNLLREQVPIKNLDVILPVFGKFILRNKPLIWITEEVRIKIKDSLPGNDLTYQLLKLPAELEETIKKGMWNRDGKIFFAIEPVKVQALLKEIGEIIAGKDLNNLALVTELKWTRPFVKRLIELQFPGVKVLKKEELIPPLKKEFKMAGEYQK